MVLWGFRWFRLFLNPFARESFEHISESDRRLYILGRLEDAEFSEWSWTVVVAGVGFFTDAYSIFAINMVIPMLEIIYYGGDMPHGYQTALSVVTLGGSIVGQIGFGLGADIWGRRKMYGLELLITIGATLGVVMSSNGTAGSMSVIAWLLVWRGVLGVGIGAEFAPTRLRGKMLTAVFMCQPLGQLASTLVTLIATVRYRKGIPPDATATHCDITCLNTMDSIWRWIIGVGVIPAVVALWFRLTIIESPRYTADVGRDTRKAASELEQYLLLQAQTARLSTQSVINNIQEGYPLRRIFSSEESGVASDDGSAQQSLSQTPYKSSPALPSELYPADGRHFEEVGETVSVAAQSGAASVEAAMPRSSLPVLHEPDSRQEPEPEFLDNPELEAAEEISTPPAPSWKDFKQYFWHDGNLRTLMATSFCWFCVDLPFYGLGLNSPKIITTIWYGKSTPPTQLYAMVVQNVWQSLIVVSLGAIVGCAITFVTIDKLGRRNIQLNGFFWLFILFVVIGGSFNHLYEIGGTSAIIVLYILCQIFFNFGPNTTSYIIPAELFPTRYRGLCHGVSAASGKLGSVVAQLFLAYINYGKAVDYHIIQKWLPNSLLIFSIFMLLGLLTTIKWIPGAEQNANGSVKTLEQWAVGRETPNRFAQTRLALSIQSVYHVLAAIVDRIYLIVDGLAGGDERERRAEILRQNEETEREMRVIEELGSRPGSIRDEAGESRPSPMVNGRI